MSSREEKPSWSVFDCVKTMSVAPEKLMAEINASIVALEYACAAYSQSPVLKTNNGSCQYDARMADQAYKLGMASMAAGKVDEAILSLNVALSKCPPDKTDAVAKLQSLISLASQKQLTQKQLRKSSN